MTTNAEISVAGRVNQLFDHLGIERAHIAASVAGDLHDLMQTRQDLIASLMLVSPRGFRHDLLSPLEFRLLLLTGDHGPIARQVGSSIAKRPTAKHVALKAYENAIWSNIAADRTNEVASAFEMFLENLDHLGVPDEVRLPEGQGEVAGITYRVRGNGPPLILFPLALSPSQWEPLIPRLSQQYCTITLGGAHLGFVRFLEERAQLGYRPLVRNLFEELQLRADEKVLDVGCGSGAHDRYLVARTDRANPIVAIDHSPYMIREARAIAERDDLDEIIDFQEGNAEALPFPDNSFDVVFSVTVMEEVDADKMLLEMVRVAKPGGRVGVLVRAVDMPWHVNLPLPSAVKNKVESPGVLGGGVTAGGCADVSLYTRFAKPGLSQLKMLPQLTASSSGPMFQNQQSQALSALSDAEAEVWRSAVEQAEGTFFIAMPFHCAVGTKS
jgi:SAM-dependent methyltransferase